MLLCANFHLKIATLWLAISAAISMLPQVTAGTSTSTSASPAQEQLPQRIYGLLDKLSCCRRQPNASAKFALLLAEFLIKQKMRFMPPTRYERQLYYHLLHRMEEHKASLPAVDSLSLLEKQILEHAFQHNVLLLAPSLKYGELNANAEYEQLAMNYDSLLGVGQPNRTASDLCMRDIVELDPKQCKLSLQCLDILTSAMEAYGYQRTHQVLLLYMLQHHRCAAQLSPPRLYDQLGRTYCNQILNEENAIRSLAMGMGKYKDLYLEQATICGLFGFNEFLNWRNVMEIDSWMPPEQPKEEHIADLALVFYTNALLMLH